MPSSVIPVPWESCITVGTGFAFKYDDEYKTPRELVNLLVSVVCRGGNLALNIPPQPDGRLPKPAVRAVDGMGDWLRVSGEAIYSTRVCAPYEAGDVAFTQRAAEGRVYAIKRLAEGERLGKTLRIPYEGEVRRVTLLGCGEVGFRRVELEGEARALEIDIPYQLVGTNPIAPAFRIER